MEGDIRPENYRWGTFGPMILTHLAKKYRVSKQAKARSVFHPVRHEHAKILLGPPKPVEDQLTNDTRAVHLWNSVLGRIATGSPPPGSYLEAVCLRHGVDA